jgi:hypothetical protein
MSSLTAQRSIARARISPAAAVPGVTLLALLAFLLGHALATSSPPANPIAYVNGVPVGVEHSPAGALAAADSYLSVEQESVEANPALETRLIETDDAHSYRAADLRSAAAVRAADPAGRRFWARGGRAVWVLGARRLDAYSGDAAQVTAWDGTVYWGGGRPAPGQSWGLDQVSLVWSGGRWLVTNDAKAAPDGPVPASTPQAGGYNQSTPAFDQELAGYTSPPYGGAPR